MPPLRRGVGGRALCHRPGMKKLKLRSRTEKELSGFQDKAGGFGGFRSPRAAEGLSEQHLRPESSQPEGSERNPRAP